MNLNDMNKIKNYVLLCLFILLSAIAPRISQAVVTPMNDYCVAPVGITTAMPNLLLMIDNSGSMYDLLYTDTTNKYCPNKPTTACTSDADCSGFTPAYCVQSATTTTTTTTTPLACPLLTDAECRLCPAGATCSAPFDASDTCSTSGANKYQCKKNKVTTTIVTVTPISCTNDGDCPGGDEDKCNNHCGISRSCFDDSYDDTVVYPGLFRTPANPGDVQAKYQFVSALTAAVAPITATNANKDEFAVIANLPATCDYGGASSTTPFVCVNLHTAGANLGKVSHFSATGNFLNWLTTSKFDVEKQILTGGKFLNNDLAAGRNLVGESRGCAGRKFIKTVPGLTGLTFAMRGGLTEGIDETTNEATESGLTYIQIYKGTFNTAACSAAMSDWMNITNTNLGTVQNDSKDCLGSAATADLTAANQTMHDCYWYFTGHELSNLNVLQNRCVDVWNLVSAASITDTSYGGAVCSSVLTHPASLVDSNTLGYLGRCYNFSTGKWDSAGGFAATCSDTENRDFCQAMGGSSAITDPPSEQSALGQMQGVPGFIMESGLSSLTLLNSYTSSGSDYVSATVSTPRGALNGFRVYIYDPANAADPSYVSPAWTWPRMGLVTKYKSLVRFGVMTFQNDGAGTECRSGGLPCKKFCSNISSRQCFADSNCTTKTSSGTCMAVPPSDGGKILTGAYIGAAAGNHNAGLIRKIDDISATSWTPYGEAFYNAIGYFARANAYPVPPAIGPNTSKNFNFPSTLLAPLSASYATTANPSQYKCQKNNILLITDGMSTADRNANSSWLAQAYAGQVPGDFSGQSGACPDYQGSKDINVLAWLAKNRNIKALSTSATITFEPKNPSEYINTYVVYTGPTSTTTANLCDAFTLMDNTAINGGTGGLLLANDPDSLYDSLETALQQISAGAVSGTAASVLASGEGSGANLIQAVFYPKKKFVNGALADGLYNEIAWTGRLTNLWYYVDPFFSQSSIREDDRRVTTDASNMQSKILDLKARLASSNRDFIVQMFYDPIAESAKASRWEDTEGDGNPNGAAFTPDIAIDDISDLWEAGTLLWQRDVTNAAGKRKLYTSITGTGFLRGNFSRNTTNPTPPVPFNNGTPDEDNSALLASRLQAANATEAANLIDWVQGIDVKRCSNNAARACKVNADCVAPGVCNTLMYRNRSVKVDLNHDGSTVSGATGTMPAETVARPWILGDILNSTPKISSWMPLNTYNKTNGDTTYGIPYGDALQGSAPDPSHFTTSATYKNRGMVFVGGNDGMLHAFKLGKLELKWDGQRITEISRLTGTAAAEFGREMWAYIPKNTLPYLRYMANPQYCHVYSVDLTPYIFDASIGGASTDDRTASSWKTILIGGMRFGGACMKSATTCVDVDGDGDPDCVNTPIASDPSDPSKGLGYSSYFALDITDQNDPQLLWEFADENLGYTTAGPVVLRINARQGGIERPLANGEWFVVLASGPTGPIDTGTHQFMGRSDQPLTLFILGLKDGALKRKYTTPIDNAFAGNMVGTAMDADPDAPDYQDDVVYVPYTSIDSSATPTPTWTNGGVGRLLTKEDPDPMNWVFSQVTTNTIGPVTATVAKLLDTKSDPKKIWLLFGTGREYYKNPTSPDDSGAPIDPANPPMRHLIGLKDPCYSSSGFDLSCGDSGIGLGMLDNNTEFDNAPEPTGPPLGNSGWKIELEEYGSFAYPPEADRAYMMERNITDPSASSRGLVFFTTYQPYNDECARDGRTSLWALNYKNGGVAPTNLLTGTIVLQLSTGQIAQVNIKDAFKDPNNPEHMLKKIKIKEPGRPPGPGGGLLSPRSAVKKTVHVKEK